MRPAQPQPQPHHHPARPTRAAPYEGKDADEKFDYFLAVLLPALEGLEALRPEWGAEYEEVVAVSTVQGGRLFCAGVGLFWVHGQALGWVGAGPLAACVAWGFCGA